MTEFQKKRLEYFKKSALNYDWIRLGPGDVEIFDEIINQEAVDKFMKENKELFEDLVKAGD